MAELGFSTIRDLLFYFPRHYLDRTSITPINKLKVGHEATIVGVVRAHGKLFGKTKRYEVILEDNSGAITLVWFGPAVRFWEKTFKKGQVWAATGTVNFYHGYQIAHPDLERLEDETDRMIHAGRIIPVYPQTAELNKVGLNSKGVRRLTTMLFESLEEKLPDVLPDEKRESLGLIPLNEAVKKIHYPEHVEDIETSRRRLAFDEFLQFQYAVLKRRKNRQVVEKSHRYKAPSEALKQFLSSLPFSLTDGQKKAMQEILGDLQTPHPMARLLQGDVGCGKTVVAITASLYAAQNGLQVAFMAPTEILAEQHYRSWKAPLEALGAKVELLTSRLKPSQKRKIAEQCAAGEIDILLGTHALVYDYVQFSRLGLVIIDEQHRFGVRQRGKLHAKGENPDLLVMTATPIPRTLALTLYGDLDISTIDSMPTGRKPIKSVWRPSSVRDKVYQYVRDEVKKGGLAYVIFPVIEKSEQTDLRGVTEAYEQLTKTVFAGLRVGMVHGKVPAKERDELLEKFKHGELDILVATTVVEVGIDNPNATLMVIEHAERFGLAQLHQLRGRIGRGTKEATLIALAEEPISDMTRKRLEFFTGTTDGFKIAEADLELRGPGELHGSQQSGVPFLKMVRFTTDRDLLEAARKLLQELLTNYPKIDTSYKPLYLELENRLASQELQTAGG